jgi:hypothetical protein
MLSKNLAETSPFEHVRAQTHTSLKRRRYVYVLALMCGFLLEKRWFVARHNTQHSETTQHLHATCLKYRLFSTLYKQRPFQQQTTIQSTTLNILLQVQLISVQLEILLQLHRFHGSTRQAELLHTMIAVPTVCINAPENSLLSRSMYFDNM